jgi:L-cysteate sulfo-lyase
MADAEQKGADTIITQGATQSNHARQTAAIAAKLGFGCHLLLEDRTGYDDDAYLRNGNVLLGHLHGALISRYPAGTDMNTAMKELAQHLADEDQSPYIIPGGGSNEIGALGYVNAAMELTAQANDQSLIIDHIVLATGSGGTQAGMVVGMAALQSGIPITGMSVRAPRQQQEESVFNLAQRTASHMGLAAETINRDQVVANADYVGEGYGLPTKLMIEAVQMMAQHEGILLDPVYTGKGFSGLIDLIRKGRFEKDDNVVFIHTGGNASLSGYPDIFGSQS